MSDACIHPHAQPDQRLKRVLHKVPTTPSKALPAASTDGFHDVSLNEGANETGENVR